jgi:hypothetical protein
MLDLERDKNISNWDPALRSVARVTSGQSLCLKVWSPGDLLGDEPIPSGTDWEASSAFSHPFD